MPDTVFQHFQIASRPDGSAWELGRGAMGVTYKAIDTELGGTVALKVINSTYLNNVQARERFVREAKAAAYLHHPNVASVFHLGHEGDSYFYTMEFVEGETLEAFVGRKGALPPRLALVLVLQAAQGLSAASERGLVHRDIKPANLMLVRRPDGPGEDEEDDFLVKVIDFGLAKTLQPEGGATASLTGGSGLIGTPYFMSPEQIDESAGPVDARSDIYSLGVTLWYLLMGKPPFQGSQFQILSQHVHQPPPLALLEPLGLPAGVTDLLARMLAKKPSDRPASSRELSLAIKAALKDLARTGGARRDDAPPAPPAPDGTGGDDGGNGAPVETLANRYWLAALVGDGPAGRVYRAIDMHHRDETVCLKLFASYLSDEAAARIVRAQAAPQANLLSILDFSEGGERQAPFVVMEWAHGFTLLALLRRRGCLAAEEAVPLARQAAAAMDHAAARELGALDLALHQIFVHFPGGLKEQEQEVLPRIPLAEWPPFRLKLDPLGGRAEAAPGAGERTILPAQAGQGFDNPVRALALLLFELLSGAPPAPGATACAPLSGLNEQANETLRAALAPGVSRFFSASAFCDELARSSVAKPAPAPLPLRLPVAETAPLVPSREMLKARARKRTLNALLSVAAAAALALAGCWLWQDRQQAVRESQRQAEEARQTRLAMAAAAAKADAEREAALAAEKKATDEAAAALAAAKAQEVQEAERAAGEKAAQRAAEAARAAGAAQAAESARLAAVQQAAQQQKQAQAQKETAARLAREQVLKSFPGDLVVAVREEPLYFQNQAQRKARLGERFRVIQSRPDLGYVFVAEANTPVATPGGMTLAIAANALQALPVDVGALLRAARQDALTGDAAGVSRTLTRAAAAAPTDPAVAGMRDAIEKLNNAQTALLRLQQAAKTAAAESARLLRNAEIAARPNPLGDDGSGKVRAMLLVKQADEVQKAAPDAAQIKAAGQEVKDAVQALGQAPLPPPPAPPAS